MMHRPRRAALPIVLALSMIGLVGCRAEAGYATAWKYMARRRTWCSGGC